MARLAKQPQDAALKKLARRRNALVTTVARLGRAAAKANGRLADAERELAEFDRIVSSLAAATGSVAAAPAAPRRGRPPKSAPRKRISRKRRGPSQADALTAVLSQADGLSVKDAIAAVKERFGMDIRRSSASTVLTLLKKQSRVINKKGVWRTVDSLSTAAKE